MKPSLTSTIAFAMSSTMPGVGKTHSAQLNGAAVTTSYIYNSVSEVLTMTDPLSKTTSNTYDVNGNLLAGRSRGTRESAVRLTELISYPQQKLARKVSRCHVTKPPAIIQAAN
jgi:hypothetical protein